jgi:hypothetical protein
MALRDFAPQTADRIGFISGSWQRIAGHKAIEAPPD